MKKGFTLIELLAVILILGIIALIAIPAVNKIINEARYESFKTSNDNMMKEIQKKCQKSSIKGETLELYYNFEGGKSNKDINVKGELPNNGYIILNNKCKIVDYYLNDNDYTYTKNGDIKKDYMLKSLISENTSIFKSMYPDYYNNIENVFFVNHLNIPGNAMEIKDPSVSGNNKIRSWLIPNEGLYDLYIGSEGTIYANYNSTYLFRGMEKVKFIDALLLNTTFVTDMDHMFYQSTLLENIKLENWYTANVNDMDQTFSDCYSLKEIDIHLWDTNNVTTMFRLFAGDRSLTKVKMPISKNNKLVELSGLFLGCIELKSLDLSNFDVSNVTNMQSTFHTCYNLEYLNLNNWDMKKVIVFPYLFYECDVLTNISMNDSDYISVNKVIEKLPELNTNSGKLSIKRIDVLENVNIDTASSKNWNVV